MPAFLKKWPWLTHGISLCLLLALCLWALTPLFKPGLFTAHDIWHQVARLYHYSQAVSEGQLFPMWISTLAEGYGYPLFIFSYHLPWIVAMPFLQLGFTLFTTLKIVFGLSFLLAAVSMYLAVYHLTKNKIAAITAAALYLIAPYHFLSLYVMAAVGTMWAFVFIPWLILGLWLSIQNHYRWAVVLISSSVAALILTHVMTLALAVPLSLFWFGGLWLGKWFDRSIKISINNKQQFTQLAFVIVGFFLAGAVTAFYLFPVVNYLPHINAGENNSGLKGLYVANFATIRQLIYSPWGFGPITENAKNGEISLQLGVAQWLAAALAALVFVVKTVKNRKPDLLLLMTGLSLGVCLFLITDYSAFFWKFTDEIFSVDYPFRLLIMAVFFGSLLAGLVIEWLPKTWLQISVSTFLVLVAVYTNRNHVRVNQYTEVPLDLYIRSEVTTNTFNEYLPKGVPLPRPGAHNPLVMGPLLTATELKTAGLTQQPQPQLTVLDTAQNTREIWVKFELASPSAVALRQFAFPNMQFYVDNASAPYQVDSRGVMYTTLNAGVHTLEARFERPASVTLAYGVSFISSLILIGLVFGKYNHKRISHEKTKSRGSHASV